MTSIAITPTLQRMHQLAFNPGSWMHDAWWTQLELTSWQDCYQRHASCRAAIDRLIRKRSALDGITLPGRLTSHQKVLMDMERDFGRFIAALGLIALNNPAHLLLKEHRQALSFLLEAQHCNQLLGLYQGWSDTSLPVAASEFPDRALQVGMNWWLRDADSDPVTHLLSLRLPPPKQVPLLPADHAHPWLLKIGRFL
ncbi:type III secretion system domain-containing protein [Pseudomonas zeae]|uniref:type III secretion system domain-containing protein n=1 Tax=Pseudomonas zeae TaxID=2745510 RepID=UPI0039DF3EEB